MRYILLAVGISLVLYATLKKYLVFHRPNVGPELMADTTLAVIGGIVYFCRICEGGKKKVRLRIE